MHWMPILAEAYILNKVREAREEREQNIEETKDQSNQQENAADAQA